MKKASILVLTILFFLSSAGLVLAQGKGTKGASEKAYEHASDQSVFNRIGDWFATVGKSKEEKAKILEERKAKRAAKRVEKEAKKQVRMTEEKMKEKTKGMTGEMDEASMKQNKMREKAKEMNQKGMQQKNMMQKGMKKK